MSTKKCKIHYRKLRRDIDQFPHQKLNTKINEALLRKKDNIIIGKSIKQRITSVPRADGYLRVLNNFHQTDDYVFGDICLFSPGQMQALLQLHNPQHSTLNEALNAWVIAETHAPEGHEYLHGIAYWMAIGDHFYQVQHISIQMKACEEYLTWLLRDQAQVIDSDKYIELQAEFDRAQMGDDLGDIKSIEIGGLIPETVRADDHDISVTGAFKDVEMHHSLGDSVRAKWEKAKDVIIGLFGEIEANKLLAQIPDEASLEVTVNIGYRSKKRKFQKEFMKNLASGLRNAPDGELRIIGKDGIIKGDDARLSADMNIKRMSENSNLLDIPHIIEQILEVHRRFLHDGKIID